MAGDFHSPKSRKSKQDDSVIATNNSSIVSKRSVERLYYPEPHFYRYFVKKPLRRSPLINRGYWLRMHAIEKVIKRFIDEPSDKQKVVINLGCGYDPLAFQCLSNDAFRCRKTRFIDVDFPELIAKKREIVLNTPQLKSLVGSYQILEHCSGIHLRSEHYSALGCNLTDIPKLEALLTNDTDLSRALILCIAEVSVTYMDVDAADSLIHWAANHNDIRFCLLEQHLPDGVEHPFAQKMIEHFDHLNTPLRSVQKYPTLVDQELRFRQCGWSLATARSLWDLWSDPLFVNLEQRNGLNLVEPFDEWEEFILFASHYFVLEAANYSPKRSAVSPRSMPYRPEQVPGRIERWRGIPLIAHSEPIPKGNVRRFGVLVPVSSDAVGHHGGLGPQTRMGSTNLYGDAEADLPVGLDSTCVQPRMCHSMTTLDQNMSLLVGGRTSPATALKDCWIFRDHWERVDDLPMALFRHSAAQVDFGLLNQNHTGVLIYGGRTHGNMVSDKWLLWREGFGWCQVGVTSHNLAARFGATMVSTGPGVGILVGGMNSECTIVSEIWEWSISGSTKDLSISLRPLKVLAESTAPFKSNLVQCPAYHDSGDLLTRNVIGRIGASLVKSPVGVLLIGGVPGQNMAQDMTCVVLTKGKTDESGKSVWYCATLDIQVGSQRLLLVGHSSLFFRNNVVITGGGAVCFSFGTYWNHCLVTLSINEGERCAVLPLFAKKAEQLPLHDVRKELSSNLLSAAGPTLPFMVKSEKVGSAQGFDRIVGQGRPVVFRNSQLGSCTSLWTIDNLKRKIGPDRAVIVHEAFDTHMDFQEKNFRYVQKSFETFLEEVSRGSRQYLRSIASTDPSGKPADFWINFPELGPDFELPSEYDTVKRNMHSSVLRVSGTVAIWLHYDVMANVLCQIKGSKRLILYPPSDVSLFSIPPGTSSSSINCFDASTTKDPTLALAHPQEVFLEPGDILFLPPLWLHTASPTGNVSISVNVFFRNLDRGYAPGRDLYGNRDLQAYEKGRQDIAKIAESFNKLPPDFGRFYLERLAEELRTKALSYSL